MKISFAGASTDSSRNSSRNNFSAVVLSSPTDIRRLRAAAGPLGQENEAIVDPEFFLPKMSKGWRSRVVAVYSAGAVVGMMYTKERVIGGIPTGVVYGDGSLGGILVSNRADQ